MLTHRERKRQELEKTFGKENDRDPKDLIPASIAINSSGSESEEDSQSCDSPEYGSRKSPANRMYLEGAKTYTDRHINARTKSFPPTT